MRLGLAFTVNNTISSAQLLLFSNNKRVLFVPIFSDKNKSETEQEVGDADTTDKRKLPFFNYQFDGTNFVYHKKE